MAKAKSTLKQDPSRTTTLRRKFISEMNKRFNELKAAIRELIVEQDVFGLQPKKDVFTTPVANADPQAWRFNTDSQKLKSFRNWFEQKTKQGLLSTDAMGKPWTAKYVDSSYRKGTERAYLQVRPELASESLDFATGSKDQFLRSAFTQPERISKMELLGSRTFAELEGVTSSMGSKMSRALAQGLADGKGAAAIARDLNAEVSKLGRARARTIARTEIIHAHAEGQLDSFVDLGVKEVGIEAEWITAGDGDVCELCAPMDGRIFPVKEARGMIPLHPNCRCAWMPVVEDGKAAKASKKKTKRKTKKKG